MPSGTLNLTTSPTPIPLFSPPYTTAINHFSDVSLLSISYTTSAANVLPLLPSVLSISEEPLITASLVTYGISTLGAYHEYVHSVEVTYSGETFNYPLSMILDSEAAIFLGREMFGYPKTFGHVELSRFTGTATFLGHVEKVAGQRLMQFEFTPRIKLEQSPEAKTEGNRVLGLRTIPSPVPGLPPCVMDLVPSRMVFTGGEIWVGDGAVSFPAKVKYHPLHKLEVLKYERAVYMHGASAVIHPTNSTFSLL